MACITHDFTAGYACSRTVVVCTLQTGVLINPIGHHSYQKRRKQIAYNRLTVLLSSVPVPGLVMVRTWSCVYHTVGDRTICPTGYVSQGMLPLHCQHIWLPSTGHSPFWAEPWFHASVWQCQDRLAPWAALFLQPFPHWASQWRLITLRTDCRRPNHGPQNPRA